MFLRSSSKPSPTWCFFQQWSVPVRRSDRRGCSPPTWTSRTSRVRPRWALWPHRLMASHPFNLQACQRSLTIRQPNPHQCHLPVSHYQKSWRSQCHRRSEVHRWDHEVQRGVKQCKMTIWPHVISNKDGILVVSQRVPSSLPMQDFPCGDSVGSLQNDPSTEQCNG